MSMELNNLYTHRVQYYETDRMGVVHHSNYVRWLEEARLEYMRLNGVNYVDIEYKGIMMPVVNVSCEYKTSAKFGDVAVIETTLTNYNGIIMEFSYRVFLENSETILVTGKSKHCFIDENTRRPVNLNKRLPEDSEAIFRVLNITNNI